MRMGLLDPASKKMERWDALIIFAMIYTAFVTPGELSFGILRDDSIDALFVCNQVINLIFWVRAHDCLPALPACC